MKKIIDWLKRQWWVTKQTYGLYFKCSKGDHEYTLSLKDLLIAGHAFERGENSCIIVSCDICNEVSKMVIDGVNVGEERVEIERHFEKVENAENYEETINGVRFAVKKDIQQ